MELLNGPARAAFRLLRAWAGAGLFFVVAFGPAAFAAAPPTPVPEYNAKAAYLLLFTRYVTWPDSSFAGPDAPIVIAVMGENPFGDVLERTVSGLKSQGRSIVVRRIATVAEALDCHLVFIPRRHAAEEAAWLERLRSHPVLTVTESGHGLEHGAVLDLALEESLRGTRVTFSASLPAAHASGLQLSASMLASARRVDRLKPPVESRL